MSKAKTFTKPTFIWSRATEKGNLDVCVMEQDAFGANSSNGIPVYLRSGAVRSAIADQLKKDPAKGDVFTIKEGEYKLVDLTWTDQDGNQVQAMSKDGVLLQTIERVG